MPLSISEDGLKCGYILPSIDKQASEGKNCKNPDIKYSSDTG